MRSTMSRGEYGNIMALWRRFMPLRKELIHVINNECIAMQIYNDYHSPEKPFDIWACVEVLNFDDIPEDMISIAIPEGKYAIFLHKGMDAAVTYRRIMTEWLPTSGYQIEDRPHFQVMGEKYKNGSPDSEEDFYIPIKSIT